MKAIIDYQILPTSTVRTAIDVIDRGRAQITLVVDSDNHLLGTVTDGDIRRALLRGESLGTSVEG